MLHTHSSNYHPRYKIFFSQHFCFPCQYHSTNAPYSFIHLPPTLYNFFSQYFSFPCQYHSTNAPYTFIHLPPTLYNVFLPSLQFPLSVSFHQCSINIHSYTTNAVYCFSPRTSVSPDSIIPPMLHTHSFIYHPRCIMFFSQHFSFPCQYHSTNAPYSFIHLPLTLYNIFLPALQFPLSLSFHHFHAHSFFYHPRCTMFFSKYFIFPCQYHSTKTPYSFIHLLPTLCGLCH